MYQVSMYGENSGRFLKVVSTHATADEARREAVRLSELAHASGVVFIAEVRR